MPATAGEQLRFSPGCDCCGTVTPETCTDNVQVKWRSVEAVSVTPQFSRKWIVFKCLFQLRKKSNGAVGCGSGYVNGGDPYEVLLIWDAESAGTGTYGNDEVSFIRVRSTSPNLEVDAVFDAIPRDDWPFGNPGPGPGPTCSPIWDGDDGEAACTFRYAWWLLKTITFTTDEGTFSFTRSADDVDGETYGTMVADDEYDCCVYFQLVCACVTRKIILEADWASYTFTVAQSGFVTPGGGESYSCPPGGSGYIPRECDCCNDTVVLTTTNEASTQKWDGYYLGAFLDHTNTGCDCCDGDTGCMRGSMHIGDPYGCATSCESNLTIECGAGVSLTVDGDIVCLSYSNGSTTTLYIACNDKHPLYDAVTDDEWIDSSADYVGCCKNDARVVTVTE